MEPNNVLSSIFWVDRSRYVHKRELSDLTASCHWLGASASQEDLTHRPRFRRGGLPQPVFTCGPQWVSIYLRFSLCNYVHLSLLTKAQTRVPVWFCFVFVRVICQAHRREKGFFLGGGGGGDVCTEVSLNTQYQKRLSLFLSPSHRLCWSL